MKGKEDREDKKRVIDDWKQDTFSSGAGKTVSAKFIMRYFATADDQENFSKKKKKSDGAMTEVEEQILGNTYSECVHSYFYNGDTALIIQLKHSYKSNYGSIW